MALKDDILAELLKCDFISGEALAEKYYISRNGIWKIIKKLREEGYEIEAVTNKGYHLKGNINKISAGAIKSKINTYWDFEILNEVDSTNNYAKELAVSGNRNNTVVIAEKQTGGKGRMGRSFFSPEGNGLYMSVLCRPDIEVSSSPLITSYTAVAVAEAIEKLSGYNTNIKWVNDVFMKGRKICGILTEAGFDFEGGTVDYAVIGIGINVLGTEFPEEISNTATSIEKETGQKLSRNELAAEILNNLSGMSEGIKTKYYLNEYRKRSNVIGKKITVTCGKQKYEAEAVRIDDNAALEVKTEEGIKILNSGEVSIKL